MPRMVSLTTRCCFGLHGTLVLLPIPRVAAICARMLGTSHARQGRFELAFGINQEIPRGDDLLPALQTAQDDGAVVHLGPQFHFAGFKIAIIEGHENDLLGAGIENGASRNRKLPAVVDP